MLTGTLPQSALKKFIDETLKRPARSGDEAPVCRTPKTAMHSSTSTLEQAKFSLNRTYYTPEGKLSPKSLLARTPKDIKGLTLYKTPLQAHLHDPRFTKELAHARDVLSRHHDHRLMREHKDELTTMMSRARTLIAQGKKDEAAKITATVAAAARILEHYITHEQEIPQIGAPAQILFERAFDRSVLPGSLSEPGIAVHRHLKGSVTTWDENFVTENLTKERINFEQFHQYVTFKAATVELSRKLTQSRPGWSEAYEQVRARHSSDPHKGPALLAALAFAQTNTVDELKATHNPHGTLTLDEVPGTIAERMAEFARHKDVLKSFIDEVEKEVPATKAYKSHSEKLEQAKAVALKECEAAEATARKAGVDTRELKAAIARVKSNADVESAMPDLARTAYLANIDRQLGTINSFSTALDSLKKLNKKWLFTAGEVLNSEAVRTYRQFSAKDIAEGRRVLTEARTMLLKGIKNEKDAQKLLGARAARADRRAVQYRTLRQRTQPRRQRCRQDGIDGAQSFIIHSGRGRGNSGRSGGDQIRRAFAACKGSRI